MTLDGALFAYFFVAITWAFAEGGHGLINLKSREWFARGILCGPVWPLVLLWWARPSWLWRDAPPAETSAEEMRRLRGELDTAIAMLNARELELAKLRAEWGGFR